MKVLALIAALLFPVVAEAKVSYDETTKTLRVIGPTNMPQVVAASNYIREEEINYIEMWGPGGSLQMGIHLGNHIDKTTATVVVPKGKSCISACALAAMGGDHIRVDGKLMLHRPFISSAPILPSIEEVLAYMGRGYLITAYYLEDQGYSRSIMQNMMSRTSPCKFMVYEDLEVKKPEDLVMWSLDNSRCEMMNRPLR